MAALGERHKTSLPIRSQHMPSAALMDIRQLGNPVVARLKSEVVDLGYPCRAGEGKPAKAPRA